MQKKIVISMAVVTLLLMGVMATSVLASEIKLATNAAVSTRIQAVPETELTRKAVSLTELSAVAVNADDASITVVPKEIGELSNVEVDNLRELVPETYEETDARVIQRTRFLLYTKDGKYIMWGFVGNGHFVGTDNMDKHCWGIYGKGVFAGFYDGEFFWGNYRGGNWKAEGLFGLNSASGKYILFPTPTLTANTP
ncbi:MAG: hypothetical protein QCH99_06575 [Candidatus Bathyarchaeota archaeon]|nr:hypothetical protein [Candidatus Bathyarchaeum tardum]